MTTAKTVPEIVESWNWQASPEEAAREIWKHESLEPAQFYREMKKRRYKKRDIDAVKSWVEKMRKSPLLRIDPWESFDPDSIA